MKPNKHDLIIGRRKVLKLGVLTALTGISPQIVFGSSAGVAPPERSLAFYNTHTGERLKTVYWVEGKYLSESLGEINYILRDHRTDAIKEIDARLLDLLFAIRNTLSTNESFH